ncbi:hypothetical protein TraAM80_09079 [Trypanosoma rangeli]|uniref:Uncharacterized protein n=1 Tax=Trypanosoma rangeli TaxID=5698 RepID=A0A3R7KN56_TRYRA|nr:uncharacterized protein TraAM80_09079 [Trypanosoma rangeli]RNE97912.1 hypothetical protein TraAM80_09079 [Trypanosoma rangeli]|eukprot:RNE97912.1 hypothetical protein TraAM80_09079 [Trypanosoma rangeli]
MRKRHRYGAVVPFGAVWWAKRGRRSTAWAQHRVGADLCCATAFRDPRFTTTVTARLCKMARRGDGRETCWRRVLKLKGHEHRVKSLPPLPAVGYLSAWRGGCCWALAGPHALCRGFEEAQAMPDAQH